MSVSNAQEGPGPFMGLDIAYSPDGSRIAVAGGYGSCQVEASLNAVQIWNAAVDDQLFLLTGHTCSPTSVDWNADGTKIASSGADGLSLIWDVESATRIASVGDGGSRFGRYDVQWHPDGEYIADTNRQGASLTIWSAETGLLFHSLKLADESESRQTEFGIPAFDWSPDGRWLAVALFNGEIGQIQIWDVEAIGEADAPRHRSTFDTIELHALRWSPNSAHIAIGSANTVLVLDSVTGETIRAFDGHENFVLDLDWSPDGTRLASASYDNTVRLWDVFSGVELRKYDAEGFITAVSWSPDDEKIIFTGQAATMEQPFQTVDAPPALAIDEVE